MIPLKVFRRHAYGNPSRLGDIGKDIRGVKLTPLGVYVDQKTLVFPGLKPYSLDLEREFNCVVPHNNFSLLDGAPDANDFSAFYNKN